MPDHWIATRATQIEVSGIRKVFELGKALKDPINLSIGQPHFPVPDPIKAACKACTIDADHSGCIRHPGHPRTARTHSSRPQGTLSPARTAAGHRHFENLRRPPPRPPRHRQPGRGGRHRRPVLRRLPEHDHPRRREDGDDRHLPRLRHCDSPTKSKPPSPQNKRRPDRFSHESHRHRYVPREPESHCRHLRSENGHLLR